MKSYKKRRAEVLEAAKAGDYSFFKQPKDEWFKNDYGQTALHLAAEYGHNKFIEKLIKERKFLNLNEKAIIQMDEINRGHGETPLHCAVRGGNLSTVKLLLAHGAEIEEEDCNLSRTPFFYAVFHHQFHIVKFFLKEQKSFINKTDKDGNTPLHCAAISGNHKMVKLLLDNGANPNIQNCVGNTPLHIAIRRHYYYTTKNLLESPIPIRLDLKNNEPVRKQINNNWILVHENKTPKECLFHRDRFDETYLKSKRYPSDKFIQLIDSQYKLKNSQSSASFFLKNTFFYLGQKLSLISINFDEKDSLLRNEG